MNGMFYRAAAALLSCSLACQYAKADDSWAAVQIPATQKVLPIGTAEHEQWRNQYRDEISLLLNKAKQSSLTPAEYVQLWQAFKYRDTFDYTIELAKLLQAQRSQVDFQKLTADIGSHWMQNPELLAGLDFGDIKYLYKALDAMKLTDLGVRIGRQWMKVSDDWRKATVNLQYGTLWNGILKGSSDEALAGKRIVAQHMFATSLSQDSLARTDQPGSTVNMRYCFIQEVYPFLTEAQRAEAAETLKALCAQPGQIEQLDKQGYAYAKWFMIRMEQETPFAAVVAAPWINRTQAWQQIPGNELLWAVGRLYRCLKGEHRYDAREALARVDLHSGELEAARQHAVDAFEDAAARDVSTLTLKDLQAIERTLRLMELYDRYMAERLDWKWLLLIRQVADEGTKDKPEAWRRGLTAMGRDACKRIPQSVLPELTRLLGALQGDSTLQPKQVLGDLLAASEDSARTKPLLQDWLNDLELRSRVANAEDKVKETVARALEAKAAGRRDEAIEALKAVAFGQQKHPAIAQAACRCMLPLVAQVQPVDAATLEACLAKATSAGAPMEPDVWNYACQLLLVKAAAASGSTQQSVWQKGYASLTPGDRWISEETFARLAKPAEAVAPEGLASLRLAILTDLALSTTDIPSLCRLQQMRAEALGSMKEWPEAVAVGRLALLLAVGTQEGPRPVALQVARTLKACGAGAEDLQTLEPCALGVDAAAATTQPAAAGAKATTGAVPDKPLAEGAVRLLAQGGDLFPARRQALLHVLAGQPDKALENLCAALPVTEGPAAAAREAIDSLAIAAAVQNGGFYRCSRAAGWILQRLQGQRPEASGTDKAMVAAIEHRLAQLPGGWTKQAGPASSPASPLNDAAQVLLTACQERAGRWIGWGTDALRQGDLAWAQAFWSCAIVDAQEGGYVKAAVNDICGQAGAVGPERVQEVLRTVARQVASPAVQYAVLAGVAQLLYDEGRYQECLASFEEGDKVLSAKGEHAPKDLDTELIRAQALIRQKQVDAAVHLLDDMQRWSGPSTSKAQAGYLLGLIHMQRRETEKATQMLQQVIERYPDTPFELKAKQLLERAKKS